MSAFGLSLGKDHDWQILVDSRVKAKILEVVRAPPSLFLIGDMAYIGSIGVITPFKHTRPLTADEVILNRKLASNQIGIEQGFGHICILWAGNSLPTNLKVGLQPVTAYYAISILFTNINSYIKGDNVISTCYGISLLPLDRFLMPPSKKSIQFAVNLLV
jgi:hypothetical protein